MTRKDRTEGIYNRREVLDESERRQYCLIQLKDLLSYAYRYSEDVKKRFDRAQFNVEKFKTLSDIKHIPLLKKKELIFLQSIGPRLGGLLTKDIGELKRIFLSPGPIFDPEDRMDDYWGYTEAFYSVGFRPGDVVQVTFNYHLSPAGLMFEEPLRNLGCASIPAGPTDPGTQLDIMQKLRVSGYVGTASYLMHLAQKAEEKGINLRKDLFQEVAFVTGERLSEKMRNQLEKKFDIILRQGYGTADVGCIGYECFHKTGLHISNRCYVEICHPDTGIPLKDGVMIPVSSIEKAPSAELRPGQKDSDSLPEYALLDKVLAAYIEHAHGRADLLADGFDQVTVDTVMRLVDRAEWKRRQYPLGPKVTALAFGRDRRLPVTNAFRE